ncbi:unnamed protein product [Symbiodinium natans]|uniref:Fe2OG dioxygenase domain-containing protein n=1 Tax=Symbiodinium natans TaxID=878477 RepID=A0A812T115_9DINO|nr:unnamed protein product [Symbiodinium natans]
MLDSLDGLPSPHFAAGCTGAIALTSGLEGLTSLRSSDIEMLLEKCQQAPCGKGEKTVVDVSVRRVMQTVEVGVQWPELPSVLQEVEQQLFPGTVLRAELDKLLIYRPGDFFKEHRDSKRYDDHVATLVAIADCFHTGGAVVFYEDGREVARWEGGGGSWCCWLTSSKHEIEPVLEGYRVVATYKILAAPSENQIFPERFALQLSECMPAIRALLEERHFV